MRLKKLLALGRLAKVCGRRDCGHEELHCERCHADYEVWFTTGKLWNAVAINDDAVLWNFLCPTCFIGVAEAAGLNSRWLVTNDTAQADLLAELRYRQNWCHPKFGYE